ncbi:MAG: ribonuclease H-like domain-containing protein [Phycisphaerae bacterium]|nr:ribonuclease H-like domain-containing protein [Phycisphaerae bacterium]
MSRQRLDDLKAGGVPGARPAASPVRPTARALAEVVGGQESRCDKLVYWSLETPFDDVCAQHEVRPRSLLRPLHYNVGGGHPAVVDARRTMILDIETGGFSGAPVFLIGLALLDDRPLRVRQFLARDYPEEEAILRALARLTTERDTWVTFNGKSFDEPFLRDRATIHRVRLTPPRLHVDLLHAARRVWRGQVPNCRLGTLEEHILHRPRVGDVPSSDVPDLFHHFIRTGNAAPLRPVLVHNQIDLVSATELLLRLVTANA